MRKKPKYIEKIERKDQIQEGRNKIIEKKNTSLWIK